MATTKIKTEMLDSAALEYFDDRYFSSVENRITNPAMLISQENFNNVGTNSGFYPADQWFVYFNGTTAANIQRVNSTTPKGSRCRIRVTVTTADTSLAATDRLAIATKIEGQFMSDFNWGTAAAKPILVRFGFRGPAGTYSVGVKNAPVTRSYVTNFTISGGQANLDTEQSFIIPGDISGTWAIDNTAGLELTVCLAAGTTYQTTANSWQAGDFTGTASTSNGAGTVSNVFELFDVELYPDLNNSGVFPPWVIPNFTDCMTRCMRYYETSYDHGIAVGSAADSAENTICQSTFTYMMIAARYKVRKRSTPSISIYSTNGTANQIRNVSAGTNLNAILQSATTDGLSMTVNNVSVAAGSILSVHWVSNSRM